MVSSEITAIKTFSIKEQTEEQILKSLHKELNKDASKLISWNGLIFDIPVILFRSMLYELTSSELLLCSSKHLDLKNEIASDRLIKFKAWEPSQNSSDHPVNRSIQEKWFWDMYEDKAFNEIIQNIVNRM